MIDQLRIIIFKILIKNLKFVTIFIFYNISLSQTLPVGISENDYFELAYNFGFNWKNISTLKPYNWQDIDKNDLLSKNLKSRISLSNNLKDTLSIESFFGVKREYLFSTNYQESTSLYYYLNSHYNNILRIWLYSRITTNSDIVPHYSGIPRKQSRAGFNSGEVDASGIGLFYDYFQIWYGRGRQNWGAGLDQNLALSNSSPPYEQLSFQLKLNNLRFKYFHGFLENIDQVNRFIIGKGLELTNKANFIFSFQEVSIYSGINRSVDLAYLNPISTHLEIELNQKDNDSKGTGSQNAIWQLSLDYMPINRLRISSNLLVDELKLDNFEDDTLSSDNDYAFNNRISYSFIYKKTYITSYVKQVYVSPYTFRHEKGYNNFIIKSKTLGHPFGSNFLNYEFGLELIIPFKFNLKFNYGFLNSGPNSLLDNPYSTYNFSIEKNNEIHDKNYFSLGVEYYINNKTKLLFGVRNLIGNEFKNKHHYYLSVDYSLIKKMKI